MKCKQRKIMKFCRLWENKDQQKPIILLMAIAPEVKIIYLSVHQITADPITSLSTDVTKIQVFICSALLSLNCDCLRRMRNNIDDHEQQKQVRSHRKKQSESRVRHNTTSIYPAFLAKLFLLWQQRWKEVFIHHIAFFF